MIIPAILEKNKESLLKRINEVKDFSPVVHIDIMDKTLTKDNTLSISDIPLGLPVLIELHLMINTPSIYLNYMRKLSPYKIIVHSESDIFEKEVSILSNYFNVYGGVNIGSSLKDVISLKDVLSGILLMSVDMGASGESFNTKVFDKIKEAAVDFTNIELDGGISKDNISKCSILGVNDFAIHTALYSSQNIEKEYIELGDII